MTELEVVALIEPRPKGRPRAMVNRRTGHVMSYADPKDVQNERDLRKWVADDLPDGFSPFTGPLLLQIDAYLRPAQALARQIERRRTGGRLDALLELPHPTRRPDLSNLVKLAEDALIGLVYLDDAQIIEVKARKRWAEDGRPRWHIIVTPL